MGFFYCEEPKSIAVWPELCVMLRSVLPRCAEVKFLETVPLLANQLPRADLPTLAAALVEKRSQSWHMMERYRCSFSSHGKVEICRNCSVTEYTTLPSGKLT